MLQIEKKRKEKKILKKKIIQMKIKKTSFSIGLVIELLLYFYINIFNAIFKIINSEIQVIFNDCIKK